jgi:hypothetical protein
MHYVLWLLEVDNLSMLCQVIFLRAITWSHYALRFSTVLSPYHGVCVSVQCDHLRILTCVSLQGDHLITVLLFSVQGDHLIAECVYNSEGRTTITLGGLATREEMCLVFALYYPRIDLFLCHSLPSLPTVLHSLGIQELWPWVLFWGP